MAGDIEAFLKMAAERRRQAQGGAPAPVPQSPAPPANRATQRPQPPAEQDRRPLTSTLKPSVHDAEVVDAVLDDSRPYQPARPSSPPTPNNNQQAPNNRQKGKQKHKPPAATVSKTNTTAKPQVAATIPQSPNQIAPSGSEAKQRAPGQSLANRVVDMVRNPSSVASAFILTEILKPIDWDRED